MICRLKVFQDQGGCDGAKTLERTREHVEGAVLWRDDGNSDKGVAAGKSRQEKRSGVRMRK